MIFFNTNISSLIIIFMSCAGLFALLSAIFGMAPMRRVARYGRKAMLKEQELLDIPDSKLPSVTVVVYTRQAEDYLRNFIETILKQNYPCFDIVIVNDGSTDMTREIADNLVKEYSNVKYTFVSDTAKNVSRVKVAYTLGIKASDNDVIVTTAANCLPTSTNWLRLLCGPLVSSEIGITVGYSFVPSDQHVDSCRWTRSFDSAVTASQWLSASLCDKPFRGDQYNLAFRKKLFFENKGYASSTALSGGHDDIFINEISRNTHTAVALHPDSNIIMNWEPSQIRRLYRDECERRIFISRFLHTGSFRLQGFNSICIWLALAFSVVSIIISAPNLFPVAVCGGILLALWGYEITLFRRNARILHKIKLWWSVPFLWLARPFMTATRRQRVNAERSKHYTWTVGMKP